MTVWGYARIAVSERDEWDQDAQLRAAGAARVFTDDGVPGTWAPTKRMGLMALLDVVRAGDEVVAYRLDRIGRTPRTVLSVVEQLAGRGAALRTLADGIDTAGESGRLVVSTMAAFAQMELEVIRERSVEAARERRDHGMPVGRPQVLSSEQRALAAELRADGKSYAAIARLMGVSKSTVARIAPADVPVKAPEAG